MVTRTRLYHDGTLVLEDLPVSDVPAHLADPASVLWLDLHRPGAAELTMLGQEFGIHELALEDAAQRGQRPKLDRYRTHEFLSAYAVTTGPDGAQLTYSEIAVFLTSQAMITVRKDDGLDVEDVDAGELLALLGEFLSHGGADRGLVSRIVSSSSSVVGVVRVPVSHPSPADASTALSARAPARAR